MFRKLAVAIAALTITAGSITLSSPSFASACTSGGTGSAGDPYVICSPADLQGMSSSTSADHYILGADIDLSHTVWSSFNFSGHLDGQGHTISNLHVIDDHGSNDGLFKRMNTGSELKKLFIKDAEIRVFGDSYAGVVAGDDYGSIDQVKITGNLYTDSSFSGGVVGQLYGGSISNVDSGANLITSTNTGYVAGITAYADSTATADPTVSTSLVTGTLDTQSPIGTIMSGTPYYRGVGERPMSSCAPAHQLYVLDTSFDHMVTDFGCAPRSLDLNTMQHLTDTTGTISLSALKTVTSADPRFSTWDPTIWDFGSNQTIPHLVLFPVAPDQPGVATVTHSDRSVGFQFSAPTYNGGSPILWYDVEYMATNGTVWNSAGITISGEGRAAYTGIPNDGTRYIFRYRARNAYGDSEWAPVSNSDYASTTPSAVASVTVKSSKLGVTVAFTDPTSTGGSPITGYLVSFYKSATATSAWKTLTVTTKSAALTKLTAKIKLWVSVAPVNRDGAGASSAKVLVTVKK